MGCILSVISLCVKTVVFVFKTIIRIFAKIIEILVRIGLLLPILCVCIWVGLWLSGNEAIMPGSNGFTIFLIGLAVLTVICILRRIKKAMDKHNAKYDENGKRIKK